MGCDIHLHAEVKIKNAWHHYAHPSVPRSYPLFSIMAGVRGEEEPIAPPRGLPHDITAVTRLDYEHCREDWHTPSWLSSEEAVQVVERYEKLQEVWRPKNLLWEGKFFGYLFGALPNKCGLFGQLRDYLGRLLSR